MSNQSRKEALIGFLGNVSLFAKANVSIRAKLAEKTNIISYASGETVIQKGDVGQTMFLILSGRLKVHDGDHQVAELNEGQFFGELSLLDSEPRSMSVSTLEASVLGSIDRNDFYDVLEAFPEMTKDIIAALNNRLRSQNDKLINEYRTREGQLKQLVEIRTSELEKKNQELEVTMEDLKKSQQQLIQSEKLASLGQLTAGIAHEIQNPLNFVTNFSILSADLVNEIQEAKSEEERKEIGEDLKQNLEKINHHSKRAVGIVKGMLEHTRSGKGEKAVTDMNSLLDQFADLAHQNMKSNQMDFKIDIIKSYDAKLPGIKVIPREISRVFLNIINNALDAVKERPNGKIELKTFVKDNKIEIHIIDNGCGIADKIKDKVFDPFFTTKPTGFGNTGLGLSISNDIIKAHGGEIKFHSKENEFTEFIVELPV